MLVVASVQDSFLVLLHYRQNKEVWEDRLRLTQQPRSSNRKLQGHCFVSGSEGQLPSPEEI